LRGLLRVKGLKRDRRTKTSEAHVKDSARIPALLHQGVRARWGGDVQWANFGRYVGPVFAIDGLLAQRVGARQVVVHRMAAIDFSTSERLERRFASHRLNDLVLSIYCIGERRIAYLRSTRTSTPVRYVPAEKIHQAARRRPPSTVRVSTAALAVSLALAACASKNALLTPNGSDRVPVNTPESLARYQDLVAREEATLLEKSALERKVERLNAELAALKAAVDAQRQSAPESAAAPQSLPLSPGAPSHKASVPAMALPTRSHDIAAAPAVVVGTDQVLFRVHHATGHTEFAPSAEIEAALLKAAASAKSIWIHGRTDAQAPDALESEIALDRSLLARRFLIAHGIDAHKIRTWYRGSGDFIADNGSAEGRAQNRRVDIEVRGLDTTALASLSLSDQVGRNP
jgi:flagellar motor protein MotB